MMGYKGHSVVYMMVFMCAPDKTTLMLLGFPWKQMVVLRCALYVRAHHEYYTDLYKPYSSTAEYRVSF